MRKLQLNVFHALRDFRRTWPQLLLTDFLSRTLTVVMLTPLIGVLVKLFLLQTNDGVLADTDIAVFLLHPIGMLALLIVAAISLSVKFAETSVLMIIGFGAVEDRRVTYLEAFGYVARHAGQLLRLAGNVVARAVLLSLPFLAALGLVYVVFLGKYDINFYLTDKPPEFRKAVTLAGFVAALLAVVLLKKFANWILALPLVLFEGKAGTAALAGSTRATAPFGWKIALAVAAWLLAFFLLSAVVTFVGGLIGRAVVPDVGANVALMAAGLSVAIVAAFVGNLAVSFATAAIFPLAIVRLYRYMAGPGELRPPVADPGTLGDRAVLHVPGKGIVWAGAAVLAIFAVGGYVVSRGLSEPDDAVIIAHRGGAAVAPENTLAAFQRAIDDGADWIELDVQENADGVVVVSHDSDFMKVAGVNLKVWEATNDELRDIDIGSFFAAQYADQRVPTLREVLEQASGHLGIVIELKYYGHDHSLEAKVVDLVEQTGMVSDVMVMSLKLEGVRKTRALRPDWTYGLLNTVSLGDLTRLDLDFLALNATAATPSMIRRAHNRGMKVYVWTVDDPVQMSVMLSRGADGIITDETTVARQVLELREQLSPFGRLIVWVAGESGFLRGVDEASTEEDA
jgi:glycerophosphoryl diester phosphodiesterase